MSREVFMSRMVKVTCNPPPDSPMVIPYSPLKVAMFKIIVSLGYNKSWITLRQEKKKGGTSWQIKKER